MRKLLLLIPIVIGLALVAGCNFDNSEENVGGCGGACYDPPDDAEASATASVYCGNNGTNTITYDVRPVGNIPNPTRVTAVFCDGSEEIDYSAPYVFKKVVSDCNCESGSGSFTPGHSADFGLHYFTRTLNASVGIEPCAQCS